MVSNSMSRMQIKKILETQHTQTIKNDHRKFPELKDE
jgi:hypothetical protein